MKKSFLYSLIICLIFFNTANGQIGGFIKKATKSVTKEILGKPEPGTKTIGSSKPEPACACDQAELILDLGGKLQLDYSEVSVSVLDDGRILLKSRLTDQYYILKDGVTEGPYSSGDQKVAEFEPSDDTDKGTESIIKLYKPYVSKSGDKLLITFNGKKYGPYAQISKFVVTQSKEKFAAVVTENIIVTEDQGKKMDEAIKNAKTDQERMDIAMKYTQEMQQKMLSGGGPAAITPKLVTNVPDASLDAMQATGLSGKVKYDDICFVSYDKILDLKGKTLINIKPEYAQAQVLLLNSSNTKYAVGGEGSLLFSDNTSMTDLFNPRLVKTDGKVYLAYMYYSPKRNAIMQCKIPF